MLSLDKKHLPPNIGLAKLQKYCAYQDRCHQEVRNKCLQLKIYGDELEEIMASLVQEDYLNEERFARSYVRGKYRIKLWGRHKIMQGLKVRNISAYCIKKGMSEIEEDQYLINLKQVLQKRNLAKDFEYPSLKRKDLFRYALSKGYEAQFINPLLDELMAT